MRSLTVIPMDHSTKVELLRQRHDRLEEIKGKPGPKRNEYMKARREQHEATKHAKKC